MRVSRRLGTQRANDVSIFFPEDGLDRLFHHVGRAAPDQAQGIFQRQRILAVQQPAKKAYRPARLVVGKIVFTAGDHAGDAVMPQTFFQQFFLPVGSAEDGDVRKGAYNAPLFGVVCLQHAEAARHESDLTGDGNAFGEIARCGDQAYWIAVGPVGQQGADGAWIGRDGRQRCRKDLGGTAVVLHQPDFL